MKRTYRTGAPAPVPALLLLVLLSAACGPRHDRPTADDSAPPAPTDTPTAATSTAADLGYAVEPPSQGQSEIRILRHGQVVWSRPSFYGGVHGEPEDLTGDGIPNVLVNHPRGRSFRGYTLLELGPDGVRVLWSVEAHASQIDPITRDIFDRIREGRSLAEPPPRPR